MNLFDPAEASGYLERCGLIAPGTRVSVQPLSGGVSSDVALVSFGNKRWVLKQALPKLKVTADWRADVRRSAVERLALQEVGRIAPDAVPQVLHGDDSGGVLVMTFVAGVVWKSELLAGRTDAVTARALGHFLGRVHHDSGQRLSSLLRFEDKSLFYQLRIAPYFEVLYPRYPDSQVRSLREVVEFLMQARDVLVHGDFSPKNVIVPETGTGPVVLDWEVAHLGHAAFDLGFMMHHLWLKALFRQSSGDYGHLVDAFYAAYLAEVEAPASLGIAAMRATGALMLARVDGKSPVEYLNDVQRETARCIGSRLVLGEAATVDEVGVLVREEMSADGH